MRPWPGLRTALVRRAVVTLMLLAFVPVLAATVACQIDCVFQSTSSAATTAQGHAAGGVSQHGEPAHQAAEHLKHSGACHLAAVPALLESAARDAPLVGAAPWVRRPADLHRSRAWPPPEHRPRDRDPVAST
jgi:hypothetical protein